MLVPDFLDAAHEVREVIRIRNLVKKVEDHDREAIKQLWAWFVNRPSPTSLVFRERIKIPLKDAEVEMLASAGFYEKVENLDLASKEPVSGMLALATTWVAHSLSLGLTGAGLRITAGGLGRPNRPGTFRIDIWSGSLLVHCYMHLAKDFVGDVQIKNCGECGSPFRVVDARQRFCSRKCATRQRIRMRRAEAKAETPAKARKTTKKAKKKAR